MAVNEGLTDEGLTDAVTAYKKISLATTQDPCQARTFIDVWYAGTTTQGR